ALKTYLAAVEQAFRAGNATEHTYRPAFKALIEALAGPGITAVNEPRQIDCGAPDFIIVRGTVPLGYIEAKDVGTDLARIEKGEQLARYRESLGNLVLTDYLEFRWFLDGELRLTAALPRPDRNGRIRWNGDAASEVAHLLDQFLSADIPLKSTPQDLATRMAKLALLIRGLITRAFKSEQGEGELHAQFEAFRKVLIESLTIEQFADMYAQTLAYGLFAARCNAPAAGFTRQSAAAQLPRTNPFLRRLFNSIAGPDLDPRVAWAVDQLAELLARADMSAILEDFGRRTRREDPVVHFYETFLAAYDPKMREARGVYYTPEPVVNYIVRSVDHLLQREFGLKDGLAHSGKLRWKTVMAEATHSRRKSSTRIEEKAPWVHRVQILDPATGTGTFLYAVIQKIRERFEGNAGAWPGYVAEHLLPRLFGFELLMAPYAVAHMKLGIELEQSGYDFSSDERLGVFLTNSLEEAHEKTGLPLFTQWLADESQAASRVKRDVPVMVVLGNPPYSGHSANKGEWISQLLHGEDTLNHCRTESYFECDGKPLGERNPKWLNDDYVKFIRFAQWRIEQTGHGVLAFVTNHGYLDNPTFRGMRESLLRGFDTIWLYDLHGNTKKKEQAPDGGKDENVFDIQQGVAIGIFVKHASLPSPSGRGAGGDGTAELERRGDPEPPSGASRHLPPEGEGKSLARVFHADLYGTRALKYGTLDAESVADTPWTELAPASPSYYFVPEDGALREEYERGWKITEVMPVNSVGIATARDALTIHFTDDETWQTVSRFAELSEDEARETFQLGRDARDWKVALAQEDVRRSGPSRDRVTPIHYRPFDVRSTYYTGNSRGFQCMPRPAVMQHFFQHDNLGLVTSRLTKGENFAHAQMTRHITEVICMSPKTSNNGFVFPLWLYPRADEDLLDAAPKQKTANLAPAFVTALTEAAGDTPTPEDTLAYIYAILYAPSYRA
ncbi:MAG TPA: type ISP restriction/modification enzyme, partial [Rhodanobacteraceae bacterium]|nr:type ISP restriction/modification enzyme [Rhodanobacteraceae bacterium]